MQITIAKPTLANLQEMQNIVAPEVMSGIILERSYDEMANAIRSYIVAKDENGAIVGFCALHIHTPTLAEVRSLIVKEGYRKGGVGAKIVGAAIEEARAIGVQEILVLTYAKDFFLKLGFLEISKEEIPDSKIWVDCIKCKHFPICEEIALIKKF